ncbi:MAG: hypothetical protein EPN79_10770 [Burkholderiaceae bacterium]|nr:MAG: hypothetical protein EPN79_10770 [Burkholderiaceae bacterium]
MDAHRRWRATLSWQKSREDGQDGKRYAEHSNLLYFSLWGKFCRWLAGHRLHLHQVRAEHIDAFLTSLRGRGDTPASIRTIRTYLAEIHRVYAHLVVCGLVAQNPAAPVLDRRRQQSRFDSQPVLPSAAAFLDAYERTALTMLHEEMRAAPRSWAPARNAALRLVVSECGLKLSEICKLIPRNVTLQGDGSVVINAPGHRQVASRKLTGRELLAGALGHWLPIREGLTVRHTRLADPRTPKRLFLGAPTQSSGRAEDQGKVPAGKIGRSPIAPDLAERVIKDCVLRTLESIGIKAEFQGPQLVRNAYAARLIALGVPDTQVSRQLGMKSNFTVQAIKKILNAKPA